MIIIATMSKRAAPGRTAAREADAAYDDQGRPSKTQRKRESQDLQVLGTAVAALPPARLQPLGLPDILLQAIETLRRTKTHEGRRRQQQYIGKLMRGVDPQPLREAVAQAQIGGAQQSLALHEAEHWRAQLLAEDDALTRWMREHPHTDLQKLRTLVRQARAHARDAQGRGEAVRQDRGFRELFRFLRQHLQPSVP